MLCYKQGVAGPNPATPITQYSGDTLAQGAGEVMFGVRPNRWWN